MLSEQAKKLIEAARLLPTDLAGDREVRLMDSACPKYCYPEVGWRTVVDVLCELAMYVPETEQTKEL